MNKVNIFYAALSYVSELPTTDPVAKDLFADVFGSIESFDFVIHELLLKVDEYEQIMSKQTKKPTMPLLDLLEDDIFDEVTDADSGQTEHEQLTPVADFLDKLLVKLQTCSALEAQKVVSAFEVKKEMKGLNVNKLRCETDLGLVVPEDVDSVVDHSRVYMLTQDAEEGGVVPKVQLRCMRFLFQNLNEIIVSRIKGLVTSFSSKKRKRFSSAPARTTEPAVGIVRSPGRTSTTEPAARIVSSQARASTTEPTAGIVPSPARTSSTEPAARIGPSPARASTSEPTAGIVPLPARTSSTGPAARIAPSPARASTTEPAAGGRIFSNEIWLREAEKNSSLNGRAIKA